MAAIFLLLGLPAIAQTELMSVDLGRDTIEAEDNTGPNRRFYVQNFVMGGLSIDQPEGDVKLRPLGGSAVAFGIRYKLKLTGLLALGAEISYQYNGYRINQDTQYLWPDSVFYPDAGAVSNRRERIGFGNLQGGAFLRVNFDPKRGDNLGVFMDLGGWGGYNILSQYIAKKETSLGKREIKYSGLNDIERLHYGVMGRLGYNKVSVGAQYRLTDWFDEATDYPLLPRLLATLEVGF